MNTERYRTNDTALIEALRRREEMLPTMPNDFADRVLQQSPLPTSPPKEEPQPATQPTPTQASEDSRDADLNSASTSDRIANIPARNRQLRQAIYAALPENEQLSSIHANTTEL